MCVCVGGGGGGTHPFPHRRIAHGKVCVLGGGGGGGGGGGEYGGRRTKRVTGERWRGSSRHYMPRFPAPSVCSVCSVPNKQPRFPAPSVCSVCSVPNKQPRFCGR